MSSVPEDSVASLAKNKKLPIYDQEAKEILVLKTELPLQEQVRVLRNHVESLRKSFDQRTGSIISSGFEIERKVATTLSNLIDRRETNSNSILWVGIGTISGSILARNRSFPIRFLSPLTLFLISCNSLLPQTTQNFKRYLFNLQDRHFPQSSIFRDDLIRSSEETIRKFKEIRSKAFERTNRLVAESGEGLEKISGLKINHPKKTEEVQERN
ncbi:apolipo protein O-domain-containing protein [Phakopsora pachyrhizi]|uniref:MICOS complex subunit n=1 Tax=Phakopsora pachyrhizi TaxID=170000 RepID=A0AAV0BGC0_PHAPC|nr:apolipo protein O-domain-containing protein [Phakopsora pachyrhizi]CAH7685282.1 apolipo protein O-domain-containing protein [Phakopsora pachyrhizi]